MDYSTLTTEQLEAISNNDYSKLPDNILQQILDENRAAAAARSAGAAAPNRPQADPAGFNREAARAAGYTDAQIDAYLRNPNRAPEPAAGSIWEELKGLGQMALVPAAKVVEYAVENPGTAAATAAGIGSYIPGVNRLPVIRDIKDIREGLVDRLRPSAATQPESPVRPVSAAQTAPGAGARSVPITTGAPTPVAPAAAAPAPVAPVAPSAAPAQGLTAGARAPMSSSGGILNQATDIVRRLALEKVAPGIGQLVAGAARAAGPAGLAYGLLAPSPTGPAVPQRGPLRGSEINPATGQGWTREELAQYEASLQR